MKTIKFYPSDRSKVKISWETITQKKVSQIVKGYTIKLIISTVMLASCNTVNYVPYQGRGLLDLHDNLEDTKIFLQEDVNNGLIDEGVARNYYNLLTTYAHEVKQEHEKCRKKVLEYKIKQDGEEEKQWD